MAVVEAVQKSHVCQNFLSLDYIKVVPPKHFDDALSVKNTTMHIYTLHIHQFNLNKLITACFKQRI